MPAYPIAWFSRGHLRTLFLLIALGSAGLAAEPAEPPTPPPPKEERIVTLDVHPVLAAPPKLSFGLALQVWKDNATGKILGLYVTKVRPGSSAADKGLKPRTRIDRIDGRPVEELTASFLKDGDLNKLFINRKLSEKIVLEVLLEGSTKTKTVVLTEKPWFEFEVRTHGLESANSFEQLRSDARGRQ